MTDLDALLLEIARLGLAAEELVPAREDRGWSGVGSPDAWLNAAMSGSAGEFVEVGTEDLRITLKAAYEAGRNAGMLAGDEEVEEKALAMLEQGQLSLGDPNLDEGGRAYWIGWAAALRNVLRELGLSELQEDEPRAKTDTPTAKPTP